MSIVGVGAESGELDRVASNFVIVGSSLQENICRIIEPYSVVEASSSHPPSSLWRFPASETLQAALQLTLFCARRPRTSPR